MRHSQRVSERIVKRDNSKGLNHIETYFKAALTQIVNLQCAKMERFARENASNIALESGASSISPDVHDSSENGKQGYRTHD